MPRRKCAYRFTHDIVPLHNNQANTLLSIWGLYDRQATQGISAQYPADGAGVPAGVDYYIVGLV